MKLLCTSRALRLALLAACAVLTLTPSPSSARPPAPTLDQLPAALAGGGAGRAPLTIALRSPLSGPELRAAVIAAGAAQRAAGARGVRVQVLVDPSRAQLAAAPGSEIVIVPSGGTASLSVAGAPHAGVRLTIAGTGDGLLSAARLPSAPAVHGFGGSSATVSPGLATPVRGDQAPSSVAIAPASTSGRGTLRLSTHFTLPLDRQLTGDTALAIVSAYDASGGGRIGAQLGGGVLGASDVPATGVLRSMLAAKLSDSPALTGDTLPGWWAHPGENAVTMTATPRRRDARGTLQVLAGSRVTLTTTPRPASLQLALWPFPIYDDHAWTRATAVLPVRPDRGTLSALLTALANTERITGIPADLNVALGAPSAAEASGNLILVGSAARAAAASEIPHLHKLHATQTGSPGTLEEARLTGGSVALLASDARALTALGPGYSLGSVSGRVALIDRYGTAHTLAAGETIKTFASPRLPWLAPLAFLAVLALGWIGLRTVRAQRRVSSLPAFRLGERGGGA